ncbi:monovalent cation/H+ antiporter complex subunit F [Micrococcoides hystricis]|uniref:Monovalent cation/H+ antiporter complex subunit F n=1 Tax=Micrococcoides hystricis TaxID=1572761 RepID=A0ABV6PCW0_9MICC
MAFDPTDFNSWLILVCAIGVLMLSVAILAGLRLVFKATDAASRAVVGDLVFFSAIGLLILIAMLSDSAIVLDAALLASLVGILATIALARIITRGRR